MAGSESRFGNKELSADSKRVEIELVCQAPQAEEVFVAGDFNEWRVRDLRLRKDSNGFWRVQVWVFPGRFEFRFIVDGHL